MRKLLRTSPGASRVLFGSLLAMKDIVRRNVVDRVQASRYTDPMDYSDLITQAHQLARPVYPSEDCQAGTVGAVIVSASGKSYTGICVEFECGMGFCAEHAAVAEMLKHQESEIALVVAVNDEGRVFSPCGRCREMMWQLNDKNRDAKVILGAGEARALSELLPFR